ncbi:MAG: hypothetical protein EKK34_29265 [Mycobacterium sp.]|nr:MAG: hypothetical protein EKK34_29265 [Mycobacterium sp.]
MRTPAIASAHRSTARPARPHSPSWKRSKTAWPKVSHPKTPRPPSGHGSRIGVPPRWPSVTARRPLESCTATSAASTRARVRAHGLRYSPVLKLIANTGLRRGEALALQWDRVDLDAGVIRVLSTMSRVGGKIQMSEPQDPEGAAHHPAEPGHGDHAPGTPQCAARGADARSEGAFDSARRNGSSSEARCG